MAVYDSSVIEIPGLERSSTTAIGSVPKSTAAWADGQAVYLEASTGVWQLGGPGPMLADGAAAFGSVVGNVKCLPHIQVGYVGCDAAQIGNANNALYNGTALSKLVPLSGRSFPHRVRKIAGEAWSAASSVRRIDDTASPNYGLHTQVFGALRPVVGAAIMAAASADLYGYISTARHWFDDVTTIDQAYGATLTSVPKPSAENWTNGTTIYTNGTTYTLTVAAGLTQIGHVSGNFPVGITTASIEISYRRLDPISMAWHFLQRECYLLMPLTTSDTWIWREECQAGSGLIVDTYRLLIRQYSLILPTTGMEGVQTPPTISRWFPGLAINVPAAAVSGAGWNFPADLAVIFNAVGTTVTGFVYPKVAGSATATLEAQPVIPLPAGSPTTAADALVQGAQGVQRESYTTTTAGNLNHGPRWGYPRSLRVWSEQPDNTGTAGGVGLTITAVSMLIEERYSNPALAGADKRAWRPVATVPLAVTSSFPSGGAGSVIKVWEANIATPTYCEPWRKIDDIRYTLTRTGNDRYGSPTVDHAYSSGASSAADTPWLDNIGTVPWAYDVPTWRATIRPAATYFESVLTAGAYIPLPVLAPLVWSGAYALALVAGSHFQTLTITSARRSAPPADDDRYSKATAWWVTIVDPVTGNFLQDATSGKLGPLPRRIRLTLSATTLDSWSDTVGFTSQGIKIGNVSATAQDYRVIIDGVTRMGSLSRKTVFTLGSAADDVSDADHYSGTISVPSTL